MLGPVVAKLVTNVLISLADKPRPGRKYSSTFQEVKYASNQCLFSLPETTDSRILSDVFNVAIDQFAH